MGASIKTGGNGGGRRRRGRAHAPMSEINVTPFVDVMLVLLIIFMVTAPLLTGGMDVDLPSGKAPTIEPQKKELVKLTITKDNKIYFGDENKNDIAINDLLPRLKAVFEARGGTKNDPIYINGDEMAFHGVTTKVMQHAQEAGFKPTVVLKTPTGG